MTALDLALRAPRVVTPEGEVPASVGVTGGRIVAVEGFDTTLDAARHVRLDDDVVLMPGLVDTHVHVNEPGRTEWEGFASATRAAAAGGVTTIVDMPLNSIPPTTDVAALEVKRRTARGQVHVDVGFWGGGVPGNLGRLRALHEAGVLGFKCFLAPSGVEEFGHLDADQLEALLGEAAGLDALVIVHAEDAEVLANAAGHSPRDPRRRSYADFLASRPPEAENHAVAAVVDAAGRTGCRVHVLHLSSADALATLAAARADGVRVTAETCPHYLALTAEEVPDGATQYKCCPPIRDASNADRLWRGLRDGLIDCVVSDHSPCTTDLKCLDAGDFSAAWGGISSLQVGLPVVWTQARRRGFELVDVVRWMAENPARQAGLHHKGRVAVGFDADFCVFAPDDEVEVRASGLHHKNPVCVYEGRRLTGAVRATWLRGQTVDAEPRGRLLSRGAP